MWWSDWRPVPEARSLVQFQYCAFNGYNGWNGNHPGPKPSHRRLLHVGVRVLLVRGGNKRMAHVFAIRAISFIIQDDGPCPMDGLFFWQPLTHWIFWLLWFSSFLRQGGNIFFCCSKWTGMKQVDRTPLVPSFETHACQSLTFNFFFNLFTFTDASGGLRTLTVAVRPGEEASGKRRPWTIQELRKESLYALPRQYKAGALSHIDAGICSMRGLSPRPMAHRTIALTTELMEPCRRGYRVRCKLSRASGDGTARMVGWACGQLLRGRSLESSGLDAKRV